MTEGKAFTITMITWKAFHTKIPLVCPKTAQTFALAAMNELILQSRTKNSQDEKEIHHIIIHANCSNGTFADVG